MRNKSAVLSIPLPMLTDGTSTTTSTSIDYRWCKKFQRSLELLAKYRLDDGRSAVTIFIRIGKDYCQMIGDVYFHRLDGVMFWDDNRKLNGSWVCRIEMHTSPRERPQGGSEKFYLYDFEGSGEEAHAKLERVIQHLREHAVPQIPPKTITALHGK